MAGQESSVPGYPAPQKWYLDQRAYPGESIPPGAAHHARAYVAELVAEQEAAQGDSLPGFLWEPIGPAPIIDSHGYAQSGRIDTIAVDPTNPDLLFVGGAAGGVWRSMNGGASWTPRTDGQPSLAMGSVAIAPSNPSIVYAGTGDLVGFYGAGLLRSTDGGTSWTSIPGPFDTPSGGARIHKVVVAHNNPNHIVVASDLGVFVSTQGGLDFSQTSTPTLVGLATDVVLHPSNTNIVYAALYREAICGNQSCGGGIFRSGDGAQSWTRSGTGIVSCTTPPSTACVLGRTHLAIAPTRPDIVYAVILRPPGTAAGTDESASTAVFRYDDSTSTWTRTAVSPAAVGGLCRGQCWYNLAIAVHPTDPDGAGPLVAEDIVYVGGTWKLYRTTNAGASWENIRDECSGIFHVDIHALAFDANSALLVGTDGGIVRHPNPATVSTGATCSGGLAQIPGWQNLNGNLALTQFYPGVSLHPTNPFFLMGGTQDNGVLRFSGSTSWTQLTSQSGGDGGTTAIAASQPGTWWYAVGIGPSTIHTTVNSGASWTDVTADLDEDGDGTSEFSVFGGFHVTPFVVHPVESDLVILGLGGRVWRTDTGARSNDPDCNRRWCKNSPLLAGGITALAFAASNTNIYWVGGRGTAHYTSSGGGLNLANWADISAGLPNRVVTDLAVHPAIPTVAYATLSGFCENNPCPSGAGHVFVNVNLAAWSDISGNLPDVPVNAIVLDPLDPNRIYIGTDLGIFRARVDFPGQLPEWELFRTGLPNSPVFDLVTNAGTRTLLAATFGRGVFRLQWPVYVDGSWTGFEDGTYWFPYNTVSEGVGGVPSAGLLRVRSGHYTGPGNAPILITKPMVMESEGGSAILGSP